jgi:formylglycine-generating enzyme required for sulfatase activity
MTFLTLSILVLLLAACSKPENQDGEYFTNSIGMKFKLIPAGSFMMGSPESENGRLTDETQHKVTLTQPYYLGIYEVTQEQYEKVMGSNPSTFKGAKLPVETVNWNEAQ